MRKKDFFLAGGILLLAGVLWIVSALFLPRENTGIQITVDGEVYGIYSLEEDQEIPIGDTNVCRISGGKAKMIEARCPDHLCMKQAAVDGRGGTIVCLPNRVVIQAVSLGGEEAGDPKEPQIDAVAG